MFNQRKMFFEGEAVENPTGGNPEAPADGAAEVLDATTKSELDGLSLKIDIMDENKEGQISAIDALFGKEGKISQIEENKRNDALKYALKDAKIKMGSGDNSIDISVMEIANLFGKYIVQEDNGGRGLKVLEITDENDKKFQGVLQELVSSPKQSPLAHLIQITSNFAKIQAENGYGRETEENKLREIKEDKVLGNQTRRALAGLRSWVEGGKIDENNIPSMTVDQVLKMKYISADLRDKLIANGNDDVKQLWEKAKGDSPTYEYRVPYTNNYALKPKGQEDIVDDLESGEAPLPTAEGYTGELPGTFFDGFVNHLNDTFSDDLKVNDNESIIVDTTKVYTNNIADPSLVRLKLKVKNTSNMSGDTFVEYTLNIKECLLSNSNYNDEYIKKVVLPKIKENLVEKKKAELGIDFIKDKEYSEMEIFGNKSDIDNEAMKLRISNYFKTFSNYNNKLNFDVSSGGIHSKAIEGTMNLVINNYGSNEDYNEYTHNTDLSFPANEIVTDNYELKEDEFKGKLKNIILNILNNNPDICMS